MIIERGEMRSRLAKMLRQMQGQPAQQLAD
jgi:hypothetical protein